MKNFSAVSYGKWILAGEHAVLRGVPALVFPLSSRHLHLTYEDRPSALQLNLVGDHGGEFQLLFWGVLRRAGELQKFNPSALTGHLTIQSALPVGAGMGASAALCVAVTRWLGFLGYVAETQYYEFARNLENLFHGESSGVDIAVALSGQGLYFTRHGDRHLFQPRWQPHWFISYSGQRGVTLDCVNQVKALLAEKPSEGVRLDEDMRRAVEICEQALLQEPRSGLSELARGMEQALACFRSWNLTAGALETHMALLKNHGALAVKPTGSGGGGYVLSLWSQEPPEALRRDLISCS